MKYSFTDSGKPVPRPVAQLLLAGFPYMPPVCLQSQAPKRQTCRESDYKVLNWYTKWQNLTLILRSIFIIWYSTSWHQTFLWIWVPDPFFFPELWFLPDALSYIILWDHPILFLSWVTTFNASFVHPTFWSDF